MNPTLELDFWARLLGILALEIGAVVALGFLAQALTQSAFWRRAIWQSCFVCLLLLVASEFSGAGKGIAVWFAGKPPVQRKVSVRILPPDKSFVPAEIENEIPPLIEFSEKPAPVVRAVWWPGILWLVGFALIAVRILFARILFLTLRWRKGESTDAHLRNRVAELGLNLGIRRKIRLLESPGFSSPMTFGIAQPCIALPKNFARNFNPAEQNAMLTHELAHVAARDPFWYLLADIAGALLWWHPLVWLARRRLHSASELAADEAAAILENGPGTLAECLVNLGHRATQSRSFGWLGVDGNGFRSPLGQRVERLLNLKPAQKSERRVWPSFIAKTAFTIFFGGLIVFTSGWIQNGQALREKNFTSAVQKSWNRSFASMTLTAFGKEKEEPTALIQDGKLLFEMGKFDEADIKLDEALKIDAKNKSALYYKSLIKEAKSAKPDSRVELLHPTIPPTTLRKANVDAPRPSGIAPSLEETNAVALYTRTFKLDPKEFVKHLGNALPDFTDEFDKENASLASSDKADRQSRINRRIVAFLAAFGVDFGRVRSANGKSVFFSEQNGRLLVRASKEDLEIVQEALENLQGVVIAPGTPHEVTLQSRVFKVNPETFSKKLGSAPSLDWSRIRNYLREAGVDFGTDANPNGKTFFYKDRMGWLMVRASPDDFKNIEKALAPFKPEPPQVTVEAKFVEVSEAALQKLGRDFFFRNRLSVLTNQTVADFFLTGTNVTKEKLVPTEYLYELTPAVAEILNDPQSRIILRALEEAGGVDVLSAPKVTTLSGRQAQISILEAHTVVNGPGLGRSVNTNIISTNGFWVENILSGPVLDVLPTVSADGFAIEMKLQATVAEFLGYDDGDHQIIKPTASPKPRARVRSMMENVSVWDGQTVVLFTEDNHKSARDRKHLFVFVTPTIIDPAGNRVHALENMPFAENSVPKQPSEK